MNQLIHRFSKVVLLGFILLFGQATLASDGFVPELQPDPEYLPDEVVGIQMRALANNNRPHNNAGIELTFRFASPNNKAATGPLERFTRLFSNPAYLPMLKQQELEIGQAEVRADRARVPVLIEMTDGAQMAYVFLLTKQSEAPYVDCWMTDSVMPIRLTRSETPSLM